MQGTAEVGGKADSVSFATLAMQEAALLGGGATCTSDQGQPAPKRMGKLGGPLVWVAMRTLVVHRDTK